MGLTVPFKVAELTVTLVAALVVAVGTWLAFGVTKVWSAPSVVPFASLAIVLGYAVLRTGSVLPAIVAHVLLDLTALAYLGGHIGTDARVVMGAATLVGLASGAMLAGRRLGLRRRVPAVIDLRAGDDVDAACRSVPAG